MASLFVGLCPFVFDDGSLASGVLLPGMRLVRKCKMLFFPRVLLHVDILTLS